MSDLQKYVAKRKTQDPQFAEGYDVGYEHFKLGVLLRQAREAAGLTPGLCSVSVRVRPPAPSLHTDARATVRDGFNALSHRYRRRGIHATPPAPDGC